MKSDNANQRKFIKRVAKAIQSDTGLVDASKEYMQVYPVKDKRVAEANASRLLNSEYGIKTMSELLAVDYPKHKRSKRLQELADARKDHVLQDGTVIPIKDNQASLRALELMAKFDGELSDNNTNIDARAIHFHVSPDEAKKLAELADRLDKLENDDKKK